MSKSNTTTTKVGRSAVTGRFTTVEKARSAPRTHVVETIKHPTPPTKPGKK